MMQGLVTNIDFLDHTIYGDEIKVTQEEKEQKDDDSPIIWIDSISVNSR